MIEQIIAEFYDNKKIVWDLINPYHQQILAEHRDIDEAVKTNLWVGDNVKALLN